MHDERSRVVLQKKKKTTLWYSKPATRRTSRRIRRDLLVLHCVYPWPQTCLTAFPALSFSLSLCCMFFHLPRSSQGKRPTMALTTSCSSSTAMVSWSLVHLESSLVLASLSATLFFSCKRYIVKSFIQLQDVRPRFDEIIHIGNKLALKQLVSCFFQPLRIDCYKGWFLVRETFRADLKTHSWSDACVFLIP